MPNTPHCPTLAARSHHRARSSIRAALALRAAGLLLALAGGWQARADDRRLLYVATPGIRDDLGYGGHGLIVFDINNGHRFVKRIATAGLNEEGRPRNVKGVCANADSHRIYVSTTHTLQCLDLTTEQLLWERAYEGGCDRMAISPDGSVLYLPTLEGDHWTVVSGDTGEPLAAIAPNSGAHNTVFGRDGKWCYLAGLKSPLLTVADATRNVGDHTIGPFSNVVRPFTVNGRQTLCFVTVNERLGFEIGDLQTHAVLQAVDVPGFDKGPVARHGCPSHGIGLTPDERQIWVCDAHNRRVHVFDSTVMPPVYIESVLLRDEPGWVTFTVNGEYAYPSTGDVIETATRRIVAELTDEEGRAVGSEKMLEIDFHDGLPAGCGDQFGIGRVTDPPGA